MIKRNFYRLIIPTITFFIGIIFQLLFAQWIPSKDVSILALLLVLVSLMFVFTGYLFLMQSFDKRMDIVDRNLDDIIKRSGLIAEYLEDGSEGTSYLRSIELVKQAKNSLIFVGHWEPLTNYEVGTSNIRNARQKFYNSIDEKIKSNLNSDSIFHRRIVQVPQRFEGKRIPFDKDIVFFEHLKYVADQQAKYPKACQLKKISSHINTQFIIIDDRYIILPVLTYAKTELQIRQGAIFFNDTQGNLIKTFKSIYQILETYSSPILPAELAKKP